MAFVPGEPLLQSRQPRGPEDEKRRRQGVALKRTGAGQLALAWLLAHDDVIPIPGTTSLARLEENIDAVNIRLSRADLDRIDRVSPKGIGVGTAV